MTTSIAADGTIVRAAIHPGIGIARVGNAHDAFYIGPQVPNPTPLPPEHYRDETGALKREAALFRIYGYNAAGEVVAELTSDNADITWSVHVANQKSGWYQFHAALDSEQALSTVDPSQRAPALRNASVADRSSLIIDPGARQISGASKDGPAYRFDTGSFMGKKVYLGELRTDEQGRLLFLGGHGVSASHDGQPAKDFANNDGWHDDTSDGPVEATVTIGGREIPVDSAWVVTAPPNYGPQQKSVRTLHDLMTDVAIRAGMLPRPGAPLFGRDILPVFVRQTDLQWVNAGFAAGFGFGTAKDFRASDWIDTLRSPGSDQKELRQQLANSFRVFERDGWSPMPWPWIYGDAMDVPPAKLPEQHVALTDTQLDMLQQWAAGEFDPGDDPIETAATLDALPLADRPRALDKAAMDFCLADAFHPGCEMTWPMRHPSMYRAPYRIRGGGEVPKDGVQPYGSKLTPEVAVSSTGPLYGQAPGSITRWMAVPWQTDTASCRSAYYAGYGPNYDPYVPTFWPARVPNHVLSEEDYRKAVDTGLPHEERVAAFNRRASWFQTLGSAGYLSQINYMVDHFDQMGLVATLPGVLDDPDIPSEIQVAKLGPGAPPYTGTTVGLTPVHDDDAAPTLDKNGEAASTARMARRTGLPDDQIVAGYIRKVAPGKRVR
ncbi:MAG: LodA/GoxA family CTQ-dependent oxidase [Alphaproteobacteria bacterium]|nr:LodA/GoxA family CTQ-dependent oxidase [Alphaproteobacteria bacterium]